jgi:hypothetical protein
MVCLLDTKQSHFLLSIYFKKITTELVRFGSKTDSKNRISPTDQSDVDREISCRLLAASCWWRVCVGTVMDGMRPMGGR